MFRSFFIFLSHSSFVRQIVMRWPIVKHMAGRFVAGESLGAAIDVIQTLNSSGINATLDHLGEHTNSVEASKSATREIITALEQIKRTQIRANISIKLTQIGLIINKALCEDNLREILTFARTTNNFIRIDMEDSSVTQSTLDLVCKMNEEGFENVGIVIQSYLYRSKNDVGQLINAHIPVRLCKGAYKEPPEYAFPKKTDVDQAYDHLSEMLIKASREYDHQGVSYEGRYPPLTALATHDEKRINFARTTAEKYKLEKKFIEFQMLFGIRRDLQRELAESGFPVRVYVPYGTEWYPYLMRRLAERPANVWFLLSNLFKH